MTTSHVSLEQKDNAAIMTEKTDDALIRDEAAHATAAEHSTSFLQAVKRHPKALLWSTVISLSIIMDGYGECPRCRPLKGCTALVFVVR